MDRPIHLSDFKMTKPVPHSEASVTIPVWITQSALDGMLELIKFIEGLQVGGSIRTVPGAFDLTIFYRMIGDALRGAEADYLRGSATPMEPVLGDTMIRHMGTINSHSGPCTEKCSLYQAPCRLQGGNDSHSACSRNGGPYGCRSCIGELHEKPEKGWHLPKITFHDNDPDDA